MRKKLVILIAGVLCGTAIAGIVHQPDFSAGAGGYTSQGTGLSISSDNTVKPLSAPSLKITAAGGTSGAVRSSQFVINPTHKSGGFISGNNLAYWRVRFYVKTSETFTGTYRIVARILDTSTYTHPTDPRYDEAGEPFELPFNNFGGQDTLVNGFVCKDKPLCAVTSTHPNNRVCSGSNNVEFTIYLSNAQGTLWISDILIETAAPHTGAFSSANWNQFETADGVHYLAFHGSGQPEYSPEHDFCSELVIDTAYKLLRAVGFNQTRFPLYWGDHFSRSEANIILYNSQPDGSGDYEASLDELEAVLDWISYYDISSLIITRGTPDWSHPLHHNNLSDGPHNGLSNPGNPNGLGDPYPGPQCTVGDHRTYPPDDWQDWRDYVTALVSRLKDKDVAYEIFNEINVAAQAGVIGGYKAVTQYVKHFAEAAYAVDPDTIIITGAMDKMLAGCVADGILNYANAVGFHHYSGDLLNTRGMVQSSGQMKHVWMTEHHGLHEELWSATRQQGNWNAFSVSGWAVKDEYKILVLQDAEGNWVHQGMPKGLGDRVVPVQNFYNFGAMSGSVDINDKEGLASNRITASVICPDSVQYGTVTEVLLRAQNTTGQTFHNVRLWPVGFVDNLGFTFQQVRDSDRLIPVFGPGEVYEIPMAVRPTSTQYKAGGTYLLGLAVVNDEGRHSIALRPVEVVPFGSFCATMIPGDLNYDCKVDAEDITIFCRHWLSSNLP